MRGSRGAFALALAAVAFACLASGGADAQAPARGNAWEATGPQKTKVTDNCVFLFKGKRNNYVYKLKQKVGSYPSGLVSSTGYYKLAVAGGQYTTFTYWWQFCGNMNFRTVTPLNRPVCGNNAFNMCPEACREPNTRICGNGCSGLMAQQYTNSQNAYCWSLGQWASGRGVSISLFSPSDPTQGVIYTIKNGDSQGCQGKAKRSFSIAIQCPSSGGPTGQAVFPTTITDLGNCAYATTMVHPAACPSLGRGTGGWTLGSTFWFLLFGGFAVYFFGGMAFRYKQLGMTGVDMVPHLEFWRELPGTLWELATGAVEKARELLNSATGGRFGEMMPARYVSHAAAGFQTIP